MIIYKNSYRQIKPNFREDEFYSKSFNAPESHFLSDEVINAAQIVRSFLGGPVTVTSTFRTPEHNAMVSGGTRSQHLTGNAIDLALTPDQQARVMAQIDARGLLYQQLRTAGINGFGLYDTFIHLDSRDNNGQLALWDQRTAKKKA